MGKVLSLATKPVRRFNIENRAAAVISKEKPDRAPEHASTKKQRDLAKSLNPNFLEEHYKKDESLDDRLKSVYVKSNIGKPIESSTAKPKKPLPQVRHPPKEEEFGIYEALTVPKGKCSLKQAIEFISNHSQDPKTHTVEAIAAKYQMSEEVVGNILQHFRMVRIFNPPKKIEEGETLEEDKNSV